MIDHWLPRNKSSKKHSRFHGHFVLNLKKWNLERSWKKSWQSSAPLALTWSIYLWTVCLTLGFRDLGSNLKRQEITCEPKSSLLSNSSLDSSWGNLTHSLKLQSAVCKKEISSLSSWRPQGLKAQTSGQRRMKPKECGAHKKTLKRKGNGRHFKHEYISFFQHRITKISFANLLFLVFLLS